jgi:hypothetical protein
MITILSSAEQYVITVLSPAEQYWAVRSLSDRCETARITELTARFHTAGLRLYRAVSIGSLPHKVHVELARTAAKPLSWKRALKNINVSLIFLFI